MNALLKSLFLVLSAFAIKPVLGMHRNQEQDQPIIHRSCPSLETMAWIKASMDQLQRSSAPLVLKEKKILYTPSEDRFHNGPDIYVRPDESPEFKAQKAARDFEHIIGNALQDDNKELCTFLMWQKPLSKTCLDQLVSTAIKKKRMWFFEHLFSLDEKTTDMGSVSVPRAEHLNCTIYHELLQRTRNTDLTVSVNGQIKHLYEVVAENYCNDLIRMQAKGITHLKEEFRSSDLKNELAVCADNLATWQKEQALKNDRPQQSLPVPANALHRAVYYGDNATVKKICDENTPETLVSLLTTVAQANRNSEQTHTPLEFAVNERNVEALETLLNKVDKKNWYKVITPMLLSKATRLGSPRLVYDLVQYGASVNTQDSTGNTPLHYAVSFRSNNEDDWGNENYHQKALTEYLLWYGANCNTVNNKGNTPLQHGLRNTSSYAKAFQPLAQMLIQHGAHLTHQNNEGETPLHIVLKDYRAKDYVDLLLPNDFPINMRDNDSNTPLHLLIPNQSFKPAEKVGYIKNWVTARGAAINTPNGNGDTPILLAVQEPYTQVFKTLCDLGASCDVKDNQDNTLLHAAAAAGRLIVVKNLVKQRGFNLKARNKHGACPLHLAAEADDDGSLVEFMATACPETIDAQDNEGETPLHYAVKSKWQTDKVVKQLITNGADVEKTNNVGETPIFYTVKDFDTEERKNTFTPKAKALIAAGTDLTWSRADGKTVLEATPQNRPTFKKLFKDALKDQNLL